MPFVSAVLTHTPFYVWALLAWLVWQGIVALQPRTQPLWRCFAVPVLFVAAGVLPLLWGRNGATLLAAWGAGALLFLPLGLYAGPRLLAVDPAAGTVTRPGGPWTLLRNVLVFVVQYGLAVASVVLRDERALLLLAGRGVSGATAGYFLGWVVSAWQQYRAEPGAGPAPGAPSRGA